MWIDSVADFHRTIAHDAAHIANQLLLSEEPDVARLFNFTATPTDSRKTVRGLDGISMEWDREGAIQTFEPGEAERITGIMQKTAQRAVQQSLHEHADLFVGVILGEARKGRNYFDNFLKETETNG